MSIKLNSLQPFFFLKKIHIRRFSNFYISFAFVLQKKKLVRYAFYCVVSFPLLVNQGYAYGFDTTSLT